MHDVLHLFFGSQKFALTKNQRGKQLHVQQSKEANIYIGKLCPKHFFLKRIVVVVVVIVGLGGVGWDSLLERACLRGASIGKLCPISFFSKRIVVVVVVVVGLGVWG